MQTACHYYINTEELISAEEERIQNKKPSPPGSSKSEQEQEQTAGEDAKDTTDEAPKAEDNKSSMDITEVVKKLDGLNSKERRKYLRQLKFNGEEIDEELLAAAQEKAKKVAEMNENEAVKNV